MMTSTYTRLLFVLLVWIAAVSGGRAQSSTKLPPVDPKRYVLFWLYNQEDPDGSYMRSNLQAAVDAGVDGVLLGVNWDRVVSAPGAEPNWSLTDNSVKFCLEHNLKVAIRILVSRDFEAINGFWTDEQAMHDVSGRPILSNRQSLFPLTNASLVNKSQDFVRAVTQRYQYLQAQGKLVFISVVISPFAELDLPVANSNRGGPLELIAFDYSSEARAAFRTWLAGLYQNNIAQLNAAYGSNYARFDDINPPQPRATYDLFSGRFGQDWYVFRHQTLKSFIDKSVGTIRSVDPSMVIINDHGSGWDWMSGLRGTYAFKNLGQEADGVKFNGTPYYNYYFQTDLLRSNVAPGKWIMSEVDGQDVATDPQLYYEQAEQCFRYGCQAMVFANFSTPVAWEQMKWAVRKLKSTGVLDLPVARVTPVASMSYTLSTIARSNINESGIMEKYLNLRAQSGNQPIAINLVEDWLGEAVPPVSETVAANRPPTVVQPIPDQALVQGQFFSLSIPANTFADADGRISGIGVTGLPAGLAYDPTNTVIQGTPTLVGSSRVLISATDDKGASVADTVLLTVTAPVVAPPTPDNKPPVVVQPVGSLEFVQNSYTSFTIPTATFADTDGQLVRYSISGLLPGLSFRQDGNSLFIAGTPTTIGTSRAMLIATDDKGATVTDTVTLIVKSPVVVPAPTTNQAPTVIARMGSLSVVQGSLFLRTIPLSNFADSDGRIVRVEAAPLPAGISYDKAERVLAGIPTAIGTTEIIITAFDDDGASVSDTFRVTIVGLSQTAVADPPVVVTPFSDQTAVQGQLFRLPVPTSAFSDPAGRISAITVAGLPPGLTYSTDIAAITGVPTQPGLSSIVVTATNNRGASVMDTFRLTVSAPAANRPPTVANPIPDQFAYQGQPFVLPIGENVFADADGQIANVTVSGLPLGLAYAPATRTITGQGLLLGNSRVIARAIDDMGASVADTFMLTVRSGAQQLPNKPPVVAKLIANQVAYAGKSYSLTIPAATFSDPDGVIASVGVTGLPVGLRYEAATRMIVGRPILLGTSVLTVTATDDRKATVTTTFLLTVRDLPANQPPVVVRQIVPQSAVLNVPFSLPLDVHNFADADGQVVSVQVSGLPAGLVYSAVAGQISGRPSAVGTNVVTVTATDDLGATTTLTFTLAVTPLDARLVLFGNAGKTIRSVADMDALDINSLPRLLNMYAETGTKTGSISLEMVGPLTRSALANGDVCTLFPAQEGFSPQMGRYTATITVYAGPNGTGTTLLTKRIHFDILVTN